MPRGGEQRCGRQRALQSGRGRSVQRRAPGPAAAATPGAWPAGRGPFPITGVLTGSAVPSRPGTSGSRRGRVWEG